VEEKDYQNGQNKLKRKSDSYCSSIQLLR